MCHQSVGLIARAIEEELNLPTVSLTSALSISQSANPSRLVFLDYPLGHTAGRPEDAQDQLAIARAATAAFHSIEEPGGLIALPNQWPEPWKDAARALSDTRSERSDAPQYQLDGDRRAAVAAHGRQLACSVCAPADVPVV